MSSEIEAAPSQIKLDVRSYFTPPGWRLATFQEATDNLEMIKQQNLFNDRQRARLLDGWMSGPSSYDIQMGDEFRSCLGHMLIIRLQPSAGYSSGFPVSMSSIYADLTINEKGREVALLLCSEDWNYEVVYFLLNAWESRETFNPLDVRGNKNPFGNCSKFEDLNKMICEMGRIFGKEGLACQKAMGRKLSADSVNEVMVSIGKFCLDEFTPTYKKILEQIFLERIDLYNEIVCEYEESSKVNWFKEFVSQEGISDAIWNFLWYMYSTSTVAYIGISSFGILIRELENEDCQTISRRNFIMSTAILYYVQLYLWFQLRKIVYQAFIDAAGHGRQRFIAILQNPLSAFYDKTKNYHILNNILINAATHEDSFVVNKVLEWGAQPGGGCEILKHTINNKTEEIMRSLLAKCQSKDLFTYAKDKRGMTALHLVSQQNAKLSMCKLVLEYGGTPDVLDNRSRLPLHYAVERGDGDIIDMLMGTGNSDTVQSQDVYKSGVEMVTQKDEDGMSPLDMALKGNNIKLLVKLLSVSEQAIETQFDKVISTKLLHEFALLGKTEFVEKLLQRGADPLGCDEQGQTALHYACMCTYDYIARKLSELMLTKCRSEEEKKQWVIKQDVRGKTALHVAAMKGHRRVCQNLIHTYMPILKIRDTDGRIPLYEAIRAGHDEVSVTLLEYLARSGMDVDKDSIIDRSGLTPLHVAVSEGRMYIAAYLLKKSKKPEAYVKTPDVLGQTALHKAAKAGDADIIKVLLHWGAHPFLERDCDGRTVFHYFAQTKLNGEDGIDVAQLLLKKCGSIEKKLLLLWASATGIGTADQHLGDSRLQRFLLQQKKKFSETTGNDNNLLRIAARLGDLNMTKELISRGAQISDIKDDKWRETLKLKDRENVLRVCKQIESIAEQGNDQPTISDNLGRSDFAHGLAALLLNPYLKPPITVGISGSWGMGKSSLMVQTEGILLKTAAQLALLPSDSTRSSFPGFQNLEHSEKGKKKYRRIETSINVLLDDTNSQNYFFKCMKNKIVKWWMEVTSIVTGKVTEEGDSLRTFLKKYNPKYHHTFKSLAAMDSTGMFKVKREQSQSETDSPTKESLVSYISCHLLKRKAPESHRDVVSPVEGSVSAVGSNIKVKGQQSQSENDSSQKESAVSYVSSSRQKRKGLQSEVVIESSTEESVPAVLTVRYNAWKYRNESEALAGMAVEITKEMEGIMTDAQWLSTCLRNTWRKQKQVIWIEIVFPCLFAVLLAASFILIVWVLLERYKVKESIELKYASLPLTVVILVWTLVKKVMSVVNPVSIQLMNYIKLPDHTDKLGYQERVISDISFLKEEISKEPFCLCTIASYIWHFIRGLCLFSLRCSKYSGEMLAISIPSANLRTIVFVDDLDRCQESVILQVLSAINLVLAVSQISVVLGMDKELIQRAIMKKHGDKSSGNKKLADKYLQKIIQLPLDLPDPSAVQSEKFLKRQLGVFDEQTNEPHMESEVDGEDEREAKREIDLAYKALFSPFDRSSESAFFSIRPSLKKMLGSTAPNSVETSTSAQTTKTGTIAIDVHDEDGTNVTGSPQTRSKIESAPQSNAGEDDQDFSEIIPIRELLFVTYSEGERDAFCHFQKMATDFRKLPREWKRLLNYHRLVWNIFLINNEAKNLDGWQVQLITWTFICWEFEEHINVLVKRWKNIGLLKTYKVDSESKSEAERKSINSISVPSGPSLRAIVEHCINKESWIMASNNDEKIAETCNGTDMAKHSKCFINENPPAEKPEENLKDKDATKPKNTEDPGNSSRKEMNVNECFNHQMMAATDDSEGQNYSESNEVAGTENLTTAVRLKNDKVEKSLLMELDALKKEIKEEMKEQLDALRIEINQLKSQLASKNEKRDDEKKLERRSWEKLKIALGKYDVSMAGIQAFQRFRFYCEAGHLPWPLP